MYKKSSKSSKARMDITRMSLAYRRKLISVRMDKVAGIIGIVVGNKEELKEKHRKKMGRPLEQPLPLALPLPPAPVVQEQLPVALVAIAMVPNRKIKRKMPARAAAGRGRK